MMIAPASNSSIQTKGQWRFGFWALFAAMFLTLGIGPVLAEEKPASELKEGEAPSKKEVGPPLYEPDDLIVNLSVPSGKKPIYLKIKLALELTKEGDIEKLEPLKARLADTFQVYLRELRVEDLQGSVGIVRLRSELLAEINNAVKPIEVRDLLFREILVQ
jgi:flagellar FliL protein